MLAWTLMCPTPPPAVTGHTSQPWQRAANRLLRECLTLGLLTGECFSSSTETGCPATLHLPGHPCIHPANPAYSWAFSQKSLYPPGISASLLGIPSGIPASIQALEDSKEQITPSTKALPSLGCHSPTKPELTSPAPLGLVTCPSWWGEAKPLGPDPVYFLCELGNVSH